MLSPDLTWTALRDEIIRDVGGACGEEPIDGLCCHIRSLLRLATTIQFGAPQFMLGEFLVLLSTTELHECSALQGLCGDFVMMVAEKVDEAIGDGGFELDPQKMPLLGPHSSRRRRIDDDFKEAVVNAAVAKKRAKTGAMVLRAQGSYVCPKLAAVWERQSVLSVQTASFREFQQARCVSLCSDAARLGEPPEENLVIVAWAAENNTCSVLPPQVRVPSTCVRLFCVCYVDAMTFV